MFELDSANLFPSNIFCVSSVFKKTKTSWSQTLEPAIKFSGRFCSSSKCTFKALGKDYLCIFNRLPNPHLSVFAKFASQTSQLRLISTGLSLIWSQTRRLSFLGGKRKVERQNQFILLCLAVVLIATEEIRVICLPPFSAVPHQHPHPPSSRPPATPSPPPPPNPRYINTLAQWASLRHSPLGPLLLLDGHHFQKRCWSPQEKVTA